MFETARAIIESSLPLNLTLRERRLAFAKRLYAGELPDAALQAFTDWHVGDKLNKAVRILDPGARITRNIFVKMCQRSVLSRRAQVQLAHRIANTNY
jgi:hypothetical protein